MSAARVSVWLFAATCAVAAGAATEVTLQDAVKARTELSLLMQEVGDLAPGIQRAMRRVIANAEAEQVTGDLLLKKEKHREALAAFERGAALCRTALAGSKLLDRIAESRTKLARTRLIAEAFAPADKLRDAARLEAEAEDEAKAGEIERAATKLENALRAYEALAPLIATSSLEDAVAARTAMAAAREPAKGIPSGEPGSAKRGSLPDLVARARAAERAAAESLDARDYAASRALFLAAEKFYRQVAELLRGSEALLADRKAAEEAMALAVRALPTDARPASFERGRLALADGDMAMAAGDLDGAKKLFADATACFARARGERTASPVPAAVDLVGAQKAWAAAFAEVDAAFLSRNAPAELAAARRKSSQAEARAAAGDAVMATALYREAVEALKAAADVGSLKDRGAALQRLLSRLAVAIADDEKAEAEKLLAQASQLVPDHPRLPALREQVAGIRPKPKKQFVADLTDEKLAVVRLSEEVTMELALIPAGAFLMGDEQGDPDERPVRKVTLTKPFHLGKHEVTQAQWEAVMGNNPSRFRGASRPVETVSWTACQKFLKVLNEGTKGVRFGLPTEAQWQYACRAGTKTRYSFGDDVRQLKDYAWCTATASGSPHPVGTKKPNPWGLFDMHGNVWEWCQDGYQAYPKEAQTDPLAPPAGPLRVLCGGSFDNEPHLVRSAARNTGDALTLGCDVGFRVALMVVPRNEEPR